VIASLCGGCSAGRAWQRAIGDLLAQLPTEHLKREVLEHFLRTFQLAERRGSQWRVVSPGAYVGRQKILRPTIVEVVDPESGEVIARDDGDAMRHCPAESAGGLAAKQEKAPRTLIRYRGYLRDAQENALEDRDRGRRRPLGPRAIMASHQPKFSGSGAVVPHTEGATWAYAQHWLTLPPSPEMLVRWGARPDAHDTPVCLGAAGLPRLPEDPEQLSDVLGRVRAERER
jgi:hypothetical protein